MTYLQLVNAVLAKLRESAVTSVSETEYSSLIGQFVNESKTQVEDAWDWDVLATTLDLTTAAGTYLYTVTGAGERATNVSVNDTTNKAMLSPRAYRWIQNQRQLTTVQSGPPTYFAWNGSDGTDAKMELYPTPDGAYALKVNLTVPQADLSADDDVLIVPSKPVIAGAYARALAERGEDGGLASSEAYGLYKNVLANHIAIESSRFPEQDCWEPC